MQRCANTGHPVLGGQPKALLSARVAINCQAFHLIQINVADAKPPYRIDSRERGDCYPLLRQFSPNGNATTRAASTS
jgi:hypothetical protein